MVGDRRPDDPGQHRGHVCEREQLRSGQLQGLADQVITGECTGGHTGQVLEVDERLRDASGGHRDEPGAHRVQQEVLGEVLHEERRAQDGALAYVVRHLSLGVLGGLLTTPGEQHDAAHAERIGALCEPAEQISGARCCDIGMERDEHAANAALLVLPGGLVVPVERRSTVP